MKILLADNDIAIRQDILKMLKKLGYEIIEASDGIEFLKYLYCDKPDMVFAEILMPKLDGHTVAMVAKKQLGIDIPMVAVTEIPQNNVIDIEEPFEFVLHKPVTIQDVLKMVLVFTCGHCFCKILSVTHKDHPHFICKGCGKTYVLQEKNGELVVSEERNNYEKIMAVW